VRVLIHISLPVELTETEIREMMVRYHFREADFFALQRAYESILPLVKAEAYVDLVLSENDRNRYPWIEEERYAVVVMSLHDRVDRMQELYLEAEEVLTAYQIDCLALEILRKAYDVLNEYVREKEGLYPLKYEFLGEKYDLVFAKGILGEIPDCPVIMNEAGQLLPQKSTIYVLELTDRPQHHQLNICEFCKNRNQCPYKKSDFCSVYRQEEKGMVHLYSGDGKGKTTAAIGLAIRALGAGKKVCFAQFLKGSRTSELNILEGMPHLTILRNQKDYGFYGNMADKERARVRKMHDDTLDQIQSLMEAGEIDLLILDEITHVYRLEAVSQKKVRTLLEHRPKELEVVLTGRDPDEFFVKLADYHTEMGKQKHPYDQGLPAREGIEF